MRDTIAKERQRWRARLHQVRVVCRLAAFGAVHRTSNGGTWVVSSHSFWRVGDYAEDGETNAHLFLLSFEAFHFRSRCWFGSINGNEKSPVLILDLNPLNTNLAKAKRGINLILGGIW